MRPNCSWDRVLPHSRSTSSSPKGLIRWAREVIGPSMRNRSNGSIKPYPNQRGLKMPPAVKVTPLAYESLGVRGMCTLLETKEVGILADAGVAMGPRFRLMPHPTEYKARAKAREKIEAAAGTAKDHTMSQYSKYHPTPNFACPTLPGTRHQDAERIVRITR